MSGWVSIHRQILDHWVCKDKPYNFLSAWIDILLECNHKKTKVNIGFKLVICDRGESLNSLKTWAKRWGWSVSKVDRFLKLLESDSMIERKSIRISTHLKVCNYDTYQDSRNSSETQVKRKRNASETQVKSNNNDNNVNNDNNKKEKRGKTKFSPPSIEEIKNYCLAKGYNIDPDEFYNFYESKGWYIGKNKMVSWKHAILTWRKRNGTHKKLAGKGGATPDELAHIVARHKQRTGT
ncbi:hypothetical protein ACFLS9_07840 [Bacteroidota bacterium]